MSRKVQVRANVKLNAYAIISDAVDGAIERGWRLAHKHTDSPGEDVIKERIKMEISNALCEVLIFDGDKH